MITIYELIKDPETGTVVKTPKFIAPITDKAVHKKELMKEEYVLLVFNSEKELFFQKGNFIEYDGQRFELVDLTKPVENKTTGGYEYSLRFDVPEAKWKNRMFFYTRQGEKEKAWNLTSFPEKFMQIVTENLEDAGLMYDTGTELKKYEYAVDLPGTPPAKHISFDARSIWDALTDIAEAWETEWYIVGNKIKVGRCETESNICFSTTNEPEADPETIVIPAEMTSQNGDKSGYATRIYPFGSTRNIPTNYREGEPGTVVEGVVEKRLKLPAGADHIDAWKDMRDEDVVEAVVAFDDVYPKYIGTVTNVEGSVGKVLDDQNNETGETYPIYTITDKNLKNLTKEHMLDELHLVFQTGSLAGMDFALSLISSDGNGTKLEIIRNETYGRFLPDSTLKPEKGTDEKPVKYVIYGYDMSYVSDELIPQAEKELEKRAIEYLANSSKDTSIYTCKPDTIRCSGFWDGRTYDKTKELDLEVGDKVKLVNPYYFEEGRWSRIHGFEKRLDNKFDVTYTVGDAAPYSRLNAIENKIAEITYKDKTYKSTSAAGVYLISRYDQTKPTDKNAFSALRSMSEFLNKKGDTAQGVIKFLRGAEFGNYSKDFLGAGAAIEIDEKTGRSYLEVDNLNVRMTAVFNELMIQKIRHAGGQIILSPASMKCIKVEDRDETGEWDYYRCYFKKDDDDNINQEFVKGDLARCQVFNGAGMKYYWREVLRAESNENFIDLAKKGGEGTGIPAAGDEIVQLGYVGTDITATWRQNAQILSSHGENAPSFIQYAGIGTGTGTDRFSLDGKEKTVISPERNKFTGAVKISNESSGWENFDGLKKEIDSTISFKNETLQTLIKNQEFAQDLKDHLSQIDIQLDGAIETWFPKPAPIPKLTNYPANTWNTDEEKKLHLGDLYYADNGKAYRFESVKEIYQWTEADNIITKALADAKNAQDTADGKRRVFVNTPTCPYDEGDLWVNANGYDAENSVVYTNELLKCKISKGIGGSFEIKDWERATKYTDDTTALAAEERLKDWSNDKVISPVEKLALKQEMKEIEAEYDSIAVDAKECGIVDGELFKAYYEACEWYKKELYYHSSDNEENITILGSLSDSQKAYYQERTKIINAISQKYTDNTINDLEYGKANLIRNSGFTGDYLSKVLEQTTALKDSQQMYSDPMLYWTGVNTVVSEDTASQSYKSIALKNGTLSQELYYKLQKGENYVVSFKAKAGERGNVIRVKVAGKQIGEPIELTPEYKRQVIKISAKDINPQSENNHFEITGNCVLCEPQLESGVIPSAWSVSPLDNDKATAQYKASEYLSKAIAEAETEVNGGLVLTCAMQLGNFNPDTKEMKEVTAGMSGIYTDNTDVAFWAGGSLTDAIAGSANAIITHGGKAIFNEAEIRGTVFATDGEFKGKVTATSGEFHGEINADAGNIGDFKITNGDIVGSIENKEYVEEGDEWKELISQEEKICITTKKIPTANLDDVYKNVPIKCSKWEAGFPNTVFETIDDGFTVTRPVRILIGSDRNVIYDYNKETESTQNGHLLLTQDINLGTIPAGALLTLKGSVEKMVSNGDLNLDTYVEFMKGNQLMTTFFWGGKINEKIIIDTTANYWIAISISARNTDSDVDYKGDIQMKVDAVNYDLGPEKTVIGCDGLISSFGKNNYFRYHQTDGFVIRVGSYGLSVTKDGIKKMTNGSSWTALT